MRMRSYKTESNIYVSKNDAIAEARGLINWVLESAICEESAYRIVQEIISNVIGLFESITEFLTISSPILDACD